MKKPWQEDGLYYGTGFDGQRICRGAMMGRASHIPEEPDQKLRMERVRFVDGDYDQGGAYWGGGSFSEPLYCAWNEVATVWVRAKNRAIAKTEVRKSISGARFYN